MSDDVCAYDVGDRVVCVEADFFPGVARIYKQLPVKLGVYTVRDLRVGVALAPLINKKVRTGEVSVLLKELVNPPQTGRSRVEPGFAHWRFVKEEQFKRFADDVEKAVDALVSKQP